MNVLGKASAEWASRPSDQRFSSLSSMYLACLDAATNTRTIDGNIAALSVEQSGGDLVVKLGNHKSKLGHYAFNQLTQRLGMGGAAGWLRSLAGKRTDKVVENLNLGIENTRSETVQLYVRDDQDKLLAITSSKYGRIYNHEVLAALIQATQGPLQGWRTPPAMPSAAAPNQPTRLATAQDVGPWTNIQEGEEIVDSGLYASDQDMFAFLIDPNHRIDDGTPDGLSRGFWVANSEVGDRVYEMTRFLFRYVCRNNNVWGADKVQTVKVKHSGRDAGTRAFGKMAVEIKKYSESSVKEEEERIRRARQYVLGANLEEVQDLVFGTKRLCTKKQVENAYDLATKFEDIDGNPNTAWGLMNGITRLSQQTPYTDERVKLDYAAGKVFAMAE